MSDLDCGDCDCGDCNCDCDCNNCDCSNCNYDCADCKQDCNDICSFCCCCCDNDPSGGGNCFSNFTCSWCASETMVDVAEDIDHASETKKERKQRIKEEKKRRRKQRRAELKMEQIGETELPPQSPSNEPVMTQPGVDPSVITLQPRGEPPSYEAATQADMS